MYKKTVVVEILVSILVVSVFILANTFHFGTVQAATDVTGIITADTTWTKANSPYNLTENIFVDEGVTLTIEPGVTVYFNGYFMNVGGTLIASGNDTEKIIMTGSGITYSGEWKGRLVFLSTSTDSIIEYAEVTSTPNTIIGIYSAPTISHSVISGAIGNAIAIIGTDAAPNINKNVISNNNGNGILVEVQSVSSIPIMISQNVFTNNSDSAISVNHGCVRISENNITESNEGIYLGSWWGTDSATISNNILSNNFIGLHFRFFAYGSLYTATNNLIINNENGINIETTTQGMGAGGTGNISNNTISSNTNAVVITCPLELTMNYNNIDNNEFNVRHNSISNINATYNWWGTTNATTISQLIYDFYDDFNIGKVEYVPFLDAPNPEAPADPDPPVAPEFPYSIALSPLIVATLIGALLFKRKGFSERT